jgi:hypothetical protein
MTMTKTTTLEAFEYIRDSGLLKKLKLAVYQFIFENPNCIQDDILAALAKQGKNTGSITARLGELQKSGFIQTNGEKRGKSGRNQCMWMTTGIVPIVETWEERLKRLGFASLDEYYASDLWKNRVQRYFSTHERKCFVSGRTDNIQLHHLTYERIGDELDEDLVPLHASAHKRVHGLIKDMGVKLNEAHLIMKYVFFGVV